MDNRDEMYEDLMNISTPKEARAFHKKYRRHGRGYGLPMSVRYPFLHNYFLGVAFGISLAAIVISCIVLLLKR